MCPSNYDYGARCTPSLGGRGVVVNFNPTLSQPVMPTERFSWQRIHTTTDKLCDLLLLLLLLLFYLFIYVFI